MTALDFIFSVVAPAGLILIMTGMGMTLRPASFSGLIKQPKPILLGVLGQIFLLPAVAVLIVFVFNLPNDLALGLILLSACPGGATSNVISFILKADVALSIMLTACSSVAILFTMPIILFLATEYVLNVGLGRVDVPVKSLIIQLLIMTVIPVVVGMVIGFAKPDFADRAEKHIRLMSILILILLVLALISKESEYFITNISRAGFLVLILLATTMGLGYAVSKLAKLPKPQLLSVVVEVGMQNGMLAIVIATAVLGDEKLTLFPSAYGMISLMLVGAISIIYSGKVKQSSV